MSKIDLRREVEKMKMGEIEILYLPSDPRIIRKLIILYIVTRTIYVALATYRKGTSNKQGIEESIKSLVIGINLEREQNKAAPLLIEFSEKKFLYGLERAKIFLNSPQEDRTRELNYFLSVIIYVLLLRGVVVYRLPKKQKEIEIHDEAWWKLSRIISP